MQQTARFSSRLEVLSVLSHANELSSYRCHINSLELLIADLSSARSSQQRWRRLLSEHNLLYRLSATVANALQLIGQRTGLDQAADDVLQIMYMLCYETSKCIIDKQEAAAGMAAVHGE